MFDRKIYEKAYREQNKEKISERGRVYREQNKDKLKAYYEQNKDKLKVYREQNKEKMRAFNKERVEKLHDGYIAFILGIHLQECPPELIELKRAHLKLIREIRG